MTLAEIKEFAPWTVTFILSLYALNKERIDSLFLRQKKTIEIKNDNEKLEANSLNNVEQSVRILKDLLDANKEHYEYRISDINSHFESVLAKLNKQLEETNGLLEEQIELNKNTQAINSRYKNIILSYERKYGKISE